VGLAKLLAVLLVALAAMPAAADAASWSAPVDVSSPSLFVDDPFIGFASSGIGLTSWRWQDGIGNDARGGVRVSTRATSGAFSSQRDAPDALVSPIIYGESVVVVSQEAAATGPRDRDRINVTFGRIDGSFRKPRTIDTVETFRLPAIAANADKIAIAYIQRARGRRRVAKLVIRRGGRFFRPRIVSPRAGVNSVAVAIGLRGDLVVAWEREGRIEARIRRPGHRSFGRVVSVGRGAKLGTHLRAAITAGGRVWLAWSSQSLSEGGDPGLFSIQAAASVTGRSIFQRPTLLDRYDRAASDEATFDLALDGKKNAFVAWSSFDGSNFRARLARARSSGRFTSFVTLSQPEYDAVVGDLATSTTGDALVVWSRLDAVGEVGTTVLAGYLPASGAYGGEEAVSRGDRARKPAAAFDPETGLPTAVWSQREGPDDPGVPLANIRTFLRASTRTP
jgi:hypothetical protein